MGEGISLPEPGRIADALNSDAAANDEQTEAGRAAQIAAQTEANQLAQAERSLKLRATNTAFKEAARYVTNFSELEELRKKAQAEIAKSGEDETSLESSLYSILQAIESDLVDDVASAIISTIDDSINLTDLIADYSTDRIPVIIRSAGVPEGTAFVKIGRLVYEAVNQKKKTLIDNALTSAQGHVADTIAELGLEGLKTLDSTALLIEKGLTPELAKIHAPRFKDYIEQRERA